MEKKKVTRDTETDFIQKNFKYNLIKKVKQLEDQ